LPGVEYKHAKGEYEQEAARVFYAAATRSPQGWRLVPAGMGGFEDEWLQNK